MAGQGPGPRRFGAVGDVADNGSMGVSGVERRDQGRLDYFLIA